MAAIQYECVYHRTKNLILVKFQPNKLWDAKMKTVPGVAWSQSLKGWTIPDTPANRSKCGLPQIMNTIAVPGKSIVAACKSAVGRISTNNIEELNKFYGVLCLKAYSPSTLRTYRIEFIQLLKTIGNNKVQDITPAQLSRYFLYCIKNGLSEHGLHSRINALKFYYEQVLHRQKMFFDIPRPKRPLQLPKVLNKEEIAAIIKVIENVKHKTMIMLGYGCGLRVSEITNLDITDIDSKRQLLLIRKGKGKKDRVISLSPLLLVMLRAYYKEYRPKKFLFEGANGQRYSIRSLESIIDTAKRKAGIVKEGSMHMLRHSFATHLLDKGLDVVMIQKLLGHNDIKTTLRYLHVTNKDLLHILSPIEDLKDFL